MFNVLQKYSEIIEETEVILYEFDEGQVRIKLEIKLTDGSRLFVKDYMFSNNKRKYAYHWLDNRGNLKIRWDNAAHWETVSTFPHHRHVGSTDNVLPSTETDAESILDHINKTLKKQV